jgi:hypothetical protein
MPPIAGLLAVGGVLLLLECSLNHGRIIGNYGRIIGESSVIMAAIIGNYGRNHR